MIPNDRKRASGRIFCSRRLMVAAGLVLSGLSLIRAFDASTRPDGAGDATFAVSPSRPQTNGEPAESKPGGARPTTPAPEPAQPDAPAQTAGAAPALPPAPAEKIAPPIQQK